MQPVNSKAIGTMVTAVGVFAVMDAALKHLAASYSPAEVACLRGAASLPFLLLNIAWTKAWPQLRITTPALHLLRAVLGVTMLMSFIYAVSLQSLSAVYAIFMSAPLMVAALSRLILGEQVPASRWVAIVVGFIGVIIALRPGAGGFASLGSLAAALSAACYACNVLTLRVLGRSDSLHAVVVWYIVILTLSTGVLAAPHWRPVEAWDWPLIAFVGLTGALAQHLMTHAFRLAPPSVVAPFEYTAIFWGFALDWLVFTIRPDPWVAVGAAIVIAGGVYIALTERRAAGALRAAAEAH
jgi:drug/metabolite transporter (DMT)-like permease